MFDFHIHSKVSFDSNEEPENIICAAIHRGLSEICFTDHYDHHSDIDGEHNLFSLEHYDEVYGKISSNKLLIRRGIEYGLTGWNTRELNEITSKYSFDYVIGSVHIVDGYDPYVKEYWELQKGRDPFRRYLDEVLERVKIHDGFDALGHINYVCKSPTSPTKKPLYYEDYRETVDEILKILIKKGRGLEINTSGVDRVGEFLPSRDFLVRFRELGGEIVTVGSDAHDASRVGQYTKEAAELAADVFGYVCTFSQRVPIFHKIK